MISYLNLINHLSHAYTAKLLILFHIYNMTQIGFVNKFGIQYYFFAVNYVLLAIDLIYLHQCILFPVGRIIQQLLGLKYKDTNNYTR